MEHPWTTSWGAPVDFLLGPLWTSCLGFGFAWGLRQVLVPRRLFITVILSVLLFLCLCGVLKHFCRKCKEPEPELDLSMDYSVDSYTRHPRSYPEEIRAPIPENPPPYDEVSVPQP